MDKNLTGSTEQYLQKLHDTQAKDEKNRRTSGRKHPEGRLQNKQH